MKNHLMREFLFLYLLIGVLGFFTITLLGSVLIENYLEKNISRNLNLEADNIAKNTQIIRALRGNQLKILEDNLKFITNFEDSAIWLLNTDNEIIVSVPNARTHTVPQAFHPDKWEENSHSIGTFYGYFADPCLTVVSPVLSDAKEVIAYVIVHFQMRRLYIRRSGALMITQILFVVMYLLTSWLVLYYYLKVHRPLKEITRGASAYANGNLTYHISINTSDEMGYLANTLNYMSDILNQNGEYQKEFISNVSHDFRSPLTSIKGYVYAILDGTIPPEAHKRYLNIIASETERLEKLTNSLLSLNELNIKKRALNMTQFDIQKTISSCASLFEGILDRKQIRLNLIFPEHETMVKADEQQIKQVLYNLLDNAIKFSPERSSIRIEIKRKGGRVFVSVKDHGCGIPKESLSKIWSRFYKTDASRGKDQKGTGLGLAIVKEIIQAHGQHIDVISTEGEGTEFIFTLEKA